MAEGLSLMTALFADHETAAHACTSLAAHGYTPADLRVLMTRDARERLLAAAVRRGRAGAALDALVTALVGPRISDERAALYDRGVAAGGIVIGIVPRSPQDARVLRQELVRAGATELMCPLLREDDAAA